MKRMNRILHITPHLGAGAGKAISGIIPALGDYENIIVLLEEPSCTVHLRACESNGVKILIAPERKKIIELCSQADIVVMNWWAHPLSVELLDCISDIKIRIVLWSHINGLIYPTMPYEFLDIFDYIFFTSPCSMKNTLRDNQYEILKSKSSVVYGMGEFYPEIQPFKKGYAIKSVFKIGYAGTLDFCKMSPDFPYICSIVKKSIPDVEFIFYGSYTEEFKNSFFADFPQIEENIRFEGYVDDIPEKLTQLDLFLYPLTKENFATTENSIIEAMAAGLPVIVMNNPAESEIVIDGFTGCIAKDADEAASKVIQLYKSEDLRRKIGLSAREYIISNYNYDKNCNEFKACIEKVAEMPLKKHNFNDICGLDIWSKFLYFSGRYKEKLERNEVRDLPAIFYSKSKSSPQHYLGYFVEHDKFIKIVRAIERKSNENN